MFFELKLPYFSCSYSWISYQYNFKKTGQSSFLESETSKTGTVPGKTGHLAGMHGFIPSQRGNLAGNLVKVHLVAKFKGLVKSITENVRKKNMYKCPYGALIIHLELILTVWNADNKSSMGGMDFKQSSPFQFSWKQLYQHWCLLSRQ